MRIRIISHGCDISRHYLETLVLLYLPCEKFTEQEKDLLELIIECFDNETLYGRISLHVDGIVYTKENKSALSYYPCVITDRLKVFVGELFISLFSEVFSYKPPWGMLTGVRPARFAYDIINRSGSDRECFDILTKYYLVSEGKARIAINIANIDKTMFIRSTVRDCSIYISIPFCPTKCRYCSFVSYSTDRLLGMIPEYIKRLSQELLSVCSFVKANGLNIMTVYVGGGTPTVLCEDDMRFLLDRVTENIDISNLSEFTFEAGRPDTVNKSKLLLLKQYGVSRISINTQTTNDEILRSVGRNHSFSDYKRAMLLARSCGFDNINTDLIAGLPGESFDSFKNSLDDVLELNPENITVHSFSLKKSSDFTVSGTRFSFCNSLVSDMIDYSSRLLSSHGYSPYYIYRHKNTEGNTENTGYCKDDKYGLYNIYMMEEIHSVFSVGAGASAMISCGDFSKVKKFYNPKYPYEYINDPGYLVKNKNEIDSLISKL